MLSNFGCKIDKNSLNYNYQVGGSLATNDPTYVVREADRELYKALKQGQFCYVLNARQTGKSSLLVRSMDRLQKEGVKCSAIDVSAIGYQNITIEQWYAGFIYTLASNLNLLDRVNIIGWLKERKRLSCPLLLAEFILEIVLDKIESSLVVFLDEIDSILALNFSMSDFFLLLENCYKKRAENLQFQRITFVIIGCATPAELIENKQRSLFNRGQKIKLYGFKEHEAGALLAGLLGKNIDPEIILREILKWTNGQPFLTQKICKIVQLENETIPQNKVKQWLENLVKMRIIENWQDRDEPEHLKTIYNRLLKNSSESKEILKIYQQLLEGKTVIVNNSKEIEKILLSGIAIERQCNLKINNLIYQTIFDRAWLQETIAKMS